MTEISYIGALVLGLMGAGHCFGMCGGIISSLSIATEEKQNKWSNVIGYQVGRITSYTLFGLAAGWFGRHVKFISDFPVLNFISGVLLILMGLYISRVWMAIRHLENLGKLLWDKVSPLSKRLLPVRKLRHAVWLGALWGWLPCGLVYTSLGYSITLASPLESAFFMLAFGIGTLPATLLAGAASMTLKQWLNKPIVRMTSALLFIIFGGYILYDVFFASSMMHHQHH